MLTSAQTHDSLPSEFRPFTYFFALWFPVCTCFFFFFFHFVSFSSSRSRPPNPIRTLDPPTCRIPNSTCSAFFSIQSILPKWQSCVCSAAAIRQSLNALQCVLCPPFASSDFPDDRSHTDRMSTRLRFPF
jgi:hypothetical protein